MLNVCVVSLKHSLGLIVMIVMVYWLRHNSFVCENHCVVKSDLIWLDGWPVLAGDGASLLPVSSKHFGCCKPGLAHEHCSSCQEQVSWQKWGFGVFMCDIISNHCSSNLLVLLSICWVTWRQDISLWLQPLYYNYTWNKVCDFILHCSFSVV